MDVDENDATQALTDGIVFIRHFAGFSGAQLTDDAVDDGGRRTEPGEISADLADLVLSERLDIDGDRRTGPLTDGILITRFMMGYTGNQLINDAIGGEATRTSAPVVESYLEELLNSGITGLFTLEESAGFASEYVMTQEVTLQQGTRNISVDLDLDFDTSDDGPIVRDQFQIYITDTQDSSRTLLDRGENGTSVFSLGESGADYQPGVVRFDGRTVNIDVSTVDADEVELVFQLLSGDNDNTSRVTIADIENTLDEDALASPVLPLSDDIVGEGMAVDISAWTASSDFSVEVENVRYDSTTGEYAGDLVVVNLGSLATGNIAVTFPDLPAGTTLSNASGDLDGVPYLNFAPAVSRGGLAIDARTTTIPFKIQNASNDRIRLIPVVLVGAANRPPEIDPIGELTVMPGDTVEVRLPMLDDDADLLTYTLETDVELPSGSLTSNGMLYFTPTPDDLGIYDFTVVTSDGNQQTRQPVRLNVIADDIQTTRLSGFIYNTEEEPLVSVPIELGDVMTLTAADGSFTLETSGSFSSDTLKIRGEAVTGEETYPFIAEKLHLLLEHELFLNVNNQIMRPIYLPALDIDNSVPIDPDNDTTVSVSVRSDETPVEVMVQAGTLLDQQGNPFTGNLSVTEVPPDLTPAALPANLRPDLVLTIQPGEMQFTQPAPITFPNTANYALGTVLNLWSINPETGDFDDVGDMEVVADPNDANSTVIVTTAGGITNSSWHFPAPPDPEPEPDDDGDEDNDCDECKETAGNFEVELHSGAVLEDHALVSYQSIGQTQGFSLHYDSLRADPRPIVHIGYSNLLPDANQRLVASLKFAAGDFEYMVPGFSGSLGGLSGGEHFWELDVNGNGRVALQADFTMLPTGVYEYDLTSGPLQFDGTTFTGTTTTQTKELRVVNTSESPFGAGWGLSGLWEIVENSDGSVLLIDGGGSELYFDAPANEGEPFLSPPGDFTTLVKQQDGTYQRTTTNQTVHTFNASHQIESVTDRNSNVWTYAYEDGIIRSITDPANLVTTFTATNGRITEITDSANRVTTLEYTNGNLVSIKDPDQTTRNWEYDDSHRMTSHTDKREFTEFVFYDFAGRAERSLRKDGTEQFYDPVQTQVLQPFEATTNPFTPPSVSDLERIVGRYVDPNGSVMESQLDKQGQAVSRIDTEGAIGSVGRNSENLTTRSSDGRGNLTTYGYDERGNVTELRDTISSIASGELSNLGTEFWLSFQQNFDSARTAKSLFFASDTETSGTVTIAGLSFSREFLVAPGEITVVELPDDAEVTESDEITQLGIRVTADLPISVVGLSQEEFTTDAFLGLPVSVTGREYIAISSPNNPINGSQFAIVAGQDGTEVQIVPADDTGDRDAGSPYLVRLDEGEVYYLRNNNQNGDLTGSTISSNLPISVFSGHSCGNIPPGFGACDHMVEQLTPVETWGTAFVTAPLATRQNGDTFRIIASADDTEITINGIVVSTLNRGDFFETILADPTAIIGTKPIAVAQFSNGTEFDGETADPFLQLVPPVEQFANQYTVTTPSTVFGANFINVVAPMVALSNITIDGELIDSGLFTQVADTSFSAAQIEIETGTYEISSSIPIGLYVYGFADFDSYGFLGGQSFSPVQEQRFSYDEVFNQLVLSVDELGREVVQELDQNNGNVTSRTQIIGERDTAENGETDDLTTTMTYGNFGLIDTYTDPLGRVTAYEYNAVGLLTAITHARGTADEAIERFEYDAAGNRTAMIDGEGNRTEYIYDLMNRLLQTIQPDPDGNGPLQSPVTTIEYDSAGLVDSVTDANGNKTVSTYDALGRLESSIAPDPDADGPLLAPVTTYRYDPAGNLETMTDPNLHTTTYAYDGRNRRVMMIDPDEGVTRFEYDTDNNLTAVVDPVNNRTEFIYDARDRLFQEIDPFNNAITYEYDSADNLISKTDRNGRLTRYSYDDIDRLFSEEWLADDSTVLNTITYEYDEASNLLSITDSFSTLTHTYDARNRVQTVNNAGTPAAPNVVLTYVYDDVGNVEQVTDTLDGIPQATTFYSYDGLNRVNSISQTGPETTEKRVDFTYNALGQYTDIDRYSDLTSTQLVIATDYTYDDQNRLTRLDHQNTAGESVAFYDYLYDIESRITQITDVNGVTEYTYDNRDQLASADYSDPARQDEFYDYDANGNRVNSSQHGTGYETGDANRLLSDGTYNYEYDNEGNMSRRTEVATGNHREFVWDHRNRLASLIEKRSDGTPIQKVEFTYDTLNRRISKTSDYSPQDAIDAVLTSFVYDREDVIFDFEYVDGADGARLSERYVHGPGIDQILAQGGTAPEWLLNDHLNSIRDVVDDSGTVVNHIRYGAFGNIVAESSPEKSSRFLFTGREFDAEIDFYYFRARYMDALIGTFLSEDPMGLAPDTNKYRYVKNTPVSLVDPTGMNPAASALQACLRSPRCAAQVAAASAAGVSALEYIKDAILADWDFIENYLDMREANTIGADKYFHCMANCEAARRGLGGEVESYLLSELRELYDEYVKGDSAAACDADRKANNDGRQGGANSTTPCRQVCAPHRPTGLPPKY